MKKISKQWIWIIVISLFFLIPYYASAGTNLIPNPGFEDGLKDWDVWSAGLSDKEKCTGNYSLEYYHLGQAYYRDSITKETLINIVPHTDYEVRFFYKSFPTNINPPGSEIFIGLLEPGVRWVFKKTFPCSDGEWVEARGTFNSGDSTKVFFSIESTGSGSGIKVFLDDVYFGVGSPPAVVCGEPPPPPGPTVGLINPLFCQDIPCVINAIINFTFYLGITIFTLMIIIGGIMYITSAGDPQKVSTAKRLLFWAVVGLAIILLAKGLISVIKNVLGGG
jgi:hypothetical protein